MTKHRQIKKFIQKHNIKNELQSSFSYLLRINNLEDLDIKSKEKIKIDLNNILYQKSLLKFHLFKTPILENNNEISYYAIEYDLNFEIIDDFFVID